MTTLHRWTQDGQDWACACYDHGPFCRLCQRVDDVPLLRTFLDFVDTGDSEVVGADKNGEILFRLTEQGQERAREVIRRMGGDPDDEDTILPALKRDIAKSN